MATVFLRSHCLRSDASLNRRLALTSTEVKKRLSEEDIIFGCVLNFKIALKRLEFFIDVTFKTASEDAVIDIMLWKGLRRAITDIPSFDLAHFPLVHFEGQSPQLVTSRVC